MKAVNFLALFAVVTSPSVLGFTGEQPTLDELIKASPAVVSGLVFKKSYSIEGGDSSYPRQPVTTYTIKGASVTQDGQTERGRNYEFSLPQGIDIPSLSLRDVSRLLNGNAKAVEARLEKREIDYERSSAGGLPELLVGQEYVLILGPADETYPLSLGKQIYLVDANRGVATSEGFSVIGIEDSEASVAMPQRDLSGILESVVIDSEGGEDTVIDFSGAPTVELQEPSITTDELIEYIENVQQAR